MKRLILTAFLVLVVAIGGALAWFLNSAAGLRWTLEQAQDRVPGTLAIDHVEGRLSGPIVATGLHYEGDGVRASAERIRVEWLPWELFSRRLHVRALEIDGLDLDVEPAQEATDDGRTAAPSGGLPIEVYLERLDLRGARVRAADAPPVEADAIRIRTLEILRDSASVAALHVAVTSPLTLLVDASAQIPLAGRGPLSADLRFRGHVEGRHVAGEVVAGGTTADLAVTGTLVAPLGLRVEGRADIGAATPEWRLSARADAFRLDELVPEARALEIAAAALDAEGSGARLRGDATIEVGDAEFGRWRARAGGRLDGADWSLPRIRVEQIGGAARLRGSATSGEGGSLVAEARWENIAWPPLGDAIVDLPSGSLDIAGTPDRYSLRLDGAVAAADLPPATVAIAGDGDATQLRLDRLDVGWLDGTVSGDGDIAWSPVPRWDLTVEASGLRSEVLYPLLEGEFGGRIASSGSIPEDGLILSAQIDALQGHVLGRPVSGHLAAKVTPDGVDLEALDLTSGTSRVTGRARIGDTWDIGWRIAAPDLSSLVPDVTGALRGNGTLTGPPGALRAAVELHGERLGYDGHRAGAFAVDADIDLGEAGSWRGTVVANAAHVAGIDLGRIALETDGTTDDHSLALRIDHPDHVVIQRARGSLAADGWRGALHEGSANHDVIGTWVQRGEAPLVIHGDGNASLGAWCLDSEPTVVCASGARSAAGALEAKLDWEALDSGRFASLLPGDDLALTGMIDGGAAVSLPPGGRVTGRIEAEARDGALHFGRPDEVDVQRIRYRHLAIEAVTNMHGTRGDVAVRLPGTDFLAATIDLPRFDPLAPALETQPLRGNVEVQMEDFSALAPFMPSVQIGPARAEAGVTLGGTVLAPLIEGEAELTLSSLAVPRVGAEATDLGLRAYMTGDRLTIVADGRMGDGAFQVSGGGTLDDGRWQVSLGVQGDDLQVLRLPALQLSASPRIAVRAGPDELAFNGTVTVPRAAIEPILPETAVTASSDVIVVGREQSPGQSPFRIGGRIEIVLGDEVTIEGRGFEGRLAGRLLLLVPRRDEILAQGEIRFVDGRYRAYGQNLAIRQGRVLYAGGPIDNPAIDVIASRTRGDRDEIEVGVRVTGTALSPAVELYSEPAMDEADILSYIIIGRPIDEAGEGEGADLYQAAASVAIAGGGALAERIGERFDLVEISIESGEETEDTAIVLGRSLSSRLYVRYIHGILDDTSAVQLRYDLDQNWAIETESGTRSGAGADITFTVDR